MQKIRLRPLRLVRLDTGQPGSYAPEIESSEVSEKKNGAGRDAIYNGVKTIPDNPETMLANVAEVEQSRGETQAQYLLKRTPHSYFFNQAYALWFFISYFLMTVIITHKVPTDQYGIFAVALTASNTILYIVAFGLEDALTTYVPRLFAEYGQAAAALLIRRLLALRFVVLVLGTVIMLFGLPVLASLIALIPINGASDAAARLRDPQLLAHIMLITVYVLGNSVASLLTAICAALMRMQLVFVINSLTQVITLALSFVVLQMGWGIDGVLWMLAIISLFNAAAFGLWLAPLIFTGGAEYKQPFKPVIQLGLSAWLTNLASGALLKQISIILLGVFAVSLTGRGYFNLSFQLADAANTLLVAGFGGIGISALAAAFVGDNYARLARSWQTLIKVETLLAAPGLVFCLFNASNIAHALYGSSYDPVGPLLSIFLFFNFLVRILGTTIHQSSLYVLGRPRQIVISQWIGILLVVLIGIALIPPFGPAGALVADGVAKTATGVLLLIFFLRDLSKRDQSNKYALGLLSFTLRFLLALFLAALPSILWHPSDRVMLTISGVLFLILCLGLLLLIKPLSAEDMAMVTEVNPRIAPYLRVFARK